MSNQQECLHRLKEAIQLAHKCAATYRRTVPVHESLKGKTLWKGDVEVFWLSGHPQAKRCYAWFNKAVEGTGTEQVIAVLEIPPVIGPATAVTKALAAKKSQV